MGTTTESTARWNGRFNAAMVTLAREARGLTQKELAAELRISQGQLSKIENALQAPNDDVLAALAKAVAFPVEFFFQPDQVYGPSVSEFFHRKRAATSMRLLDRIHAHLNIYRMHIERLLRAAEVPEHRFPKWDIEEIGGPVEAARAMRAQWQLPKGPVENVTAAIEDAGGIVVAGDFGTRLIDAVSWWIPRLPPLFFVNRDLPPDRWRLTLAHELAHMVLHHSLSPDMEHEANTFAAEFLMPAQEVRPHLQGVTSISDLARLKPYWRTSMAALLKRAQDLKILPGTRARYLWMRLSKAGYRRREPPELDPPRETPALLGELIELHLKDFGYSPAQLAQLMALHEEHLPRWYDVPALGSPSRTFRVIR